MSRYYLYIDNPPVVFAARLNMPGAISYPITSLIFDGVTTGAYTDIEADMTLLLGSTAGGDDYGRVRVQNVATATTIPLGRTSQGTLDGELYLVDNAYITVLAEYRVWSKIPRIDADGNQYKDTTVPVGAYTSTGIPPVANCGPGTGGTIDAGTSLLTVDFDGTNSYAVADGATIDTYAWDVGAGTITVGTAASSSITATFPAGRHIVALTVTDDNGTPHTARCLVVARDPASDATIKVFSGDFRIRFDGQEATIQLGEPATFPDNALVMVWEGEPFNAADRGHVHFIGWHHADDTGMRAARTGNVPTTTLHCVDIAGKLKTLPGFPQELRRVAATVTNWDEMTAPNIDKYLHYLLQWHSTALSLADFTPTGLGATYPFVVYASEGESLFDQVENDAKGLIPAHHLACNRQGQLFVNVDPMLQPVADRTSNVIGAFNEANLEELRFTRRRPPRTHWLRKHALLTATDYTAVDGVDTLLTVQCIAPGEAPGQGLSATETTEGLTPSQAALNDAGGHEYARVNAPYEGVTAIPPLDSVYIDVEPAELQWVTLTVTAATAAQRGYTFSTTRAQVKEIRRRLVAASTGSYARGQYDLEIETSGNPAVTVIPEGETSNPWAPTPPSLGLITDQEKVAAIASDGMLYTTSDFQTPSGSGGPTWAETDLSITDTKLFSFVVDPFSPGYINMDGTGAINAWVVGETNIWRVTDMFGTPGASIVHTFGTAISASSVFVSRTINASFGRYFAADADNPWLICVSHYADAVGHAGTWATYSVDGGATWATEVQISANFDSDLSGNDPANVPALWMSPRTPGYALTAAYTETANPATASAFETRDWGQTWTALSTAATDDPVERQPFWQVWTGNTTDFVSEGVGASYSMHGSHYATTGTTSDQFILCMRPPEAAVRVDVDVTWAWLGVKTGGTGNHADSVTQSEPTFVTDLDTHNFSGPGDNGLTSGSFSETFSVTNLPRDFPGNREQAEASPPTGSGGTVQWRFAVSANQTGGNTVGAEFWMTATVTEIELAGGATYTPPLETPGAILPVNRLGGDIHIPFNDNLTETIAYYGAVTRGASIGYALKRVEADGTTVTDVSPTISARDYGVNRAHFRVRAHDNDRNYVVAAVTGNGSSADTANDYQAVVVSTDGGDNWSEIVSAVNSTAAYAAAWGGDSTQILYLYGPAEYIGYSANRGTSIDSRAGNIATHSPADLIGIAGGPIS